MISGSGAGAGVTSGAAVGFPQLPQNFAPGFKGWEQVQHRAAGAASDVPHFLQNFAVGALMVSQEEQVVILVGVVISGYFAVLRLI
nr:hypothetical protein [Massilia arenae]